MQWAACCLPPPQLELPCTNWLCVLTSTWSPQGTISFTHLLDHPLLTLTPAFNWNILWTNGKDWIQAAKIGCLAQGVQPHMPSGTDTIYFIKHSDMHASWPTALPPLSYAAIVAHLKEPNKTEPKSICFTVGGNDSIERMQYTFYQKHRQACRLVCHLPPHRFCPQAQQIWTQTHHLQWWQSGQTTIDIVTNIKCLFNSMVSTQGAKLMAINIKDLYLNTYAICS